MVVQGDFECKSETQWQLCGGKCSLSPKWSDFEWFSIYAAFEIIFMRLCKRKHISLEECYCIDFVLEKKQAPTQRLTDFHSTDPTYSQGVNRAIKRTQSFLQKPVVSLSSVASFSVNICKQVVTSKFEASLQSEKRGTF